MAHNRPWYKRNGGDFVMGAMALPDSDHKWAYSAIVDMLNDHDRPIPDEPGFICGFTGLSRKKWSIVRKRLLADGKLVEVDNGYLSNPRFEREHEQRLAEHEAAVEAGRKGGRKSAAMRKAEAQAQAEMDLSGTGQADYRANNGGDKRPESPPDSAPDSSETRTTKPQKSAISNQPPPEPSRGRAGASEARDSDNTPPNEQNSSRVRACESGSGRSSVDGDMNKLVWLLLEAGGLAARARSFPDKFTQALDIARNWEASGIDLRQVALPAIKREARRMKEPANSLARFSGVVELAKAKHRPKRKRAPAPAPVFQFADEQPSITAFRQELARVIGADEYATRCHDLRFQQVDFQEDGDGKFLDVKGQGEAGAWKVTQFSDRHGPALNAVARRILGVEVVR